MNYYLYHDESKKHGYWHGMLLVPKKSKKALLKKIEEVRSYNTFDQVISFKKVKRKNRIYHVNSSLLQIGIASLIQTGKAFKHPIYLGKRNRGKKQYEEFAEKIGAKFILFREKDDHKNLSDVLDYGGKVETTLRMGLKGGIHFLGDSSSPIHIDKVHVDGHLHYGRNMDRNRLIGRLQSLRAYCSISNDPEIIDDRSSNHTREDSQTYEDCQLLQLTDVMVGAFRYQLTTEKAPIYEELTKPAKSVIERYQKGRARMQNSRWNNSLCLSQCHLEGGVWKFDTLGFEEIDNDSQGSLFK